MKKCPQCQSSYTDDTLSYCLSDGTTLIFDENISEQTLQLPAIAVTEVSPNRTDSNVQTEPITQPTVEKQGVSAVWIYSTIGLLLLFLLGGGIGIWVWLNNEPKEKTELSKSPSPTPEKQNQLQTSPTAKPTSEPTVKSFATPTPKETSTATPTPTPTPTETTYRVVGVASHDVLYLRPSAGDLKSYLAKIPPNATGLKVVGGGVKSGKATWYPVIYNGTRGWVNGRFIAKN